MITDEMIVSVLEQCFREMWRIKKSYKISCEYISCLYIYLLLLIKDVEVLSAFRLLCLSLGIYETFRGGCS